MRLLGASRAAKGAAAGAIIGGAEEGRRRLRDVNLKC
jgi:hypothetical protein